ncbi:MAG: Prolipoprotein diacylglyceryl transferase [Thermodesulfobacteriota bacterium]|nr:Prolipoprotein diacylglyceryl transferase [Thermodesulfobacteriota bacterium]
MDECLIGAFGIALAVFLRWAFKTLPGEGWQILASLPVVKTGPATWQGLNVTYYGLLIAFAVVVANAVMLVLMGALHVPLWPILVLQLMILLVCLPCARLIAQLVENKQHTLSIGGTAFLGIVVAPLLVWVTNEVLSSHAGVGLPLIPTLAAMSIAYAFGEGLGRVACISFGCCYGKPVNSTEPWAQKLFNSYHFVFYGKTKKVSYEGDMEGNKVIPVQALTSVCLVTVGLISMLAYLKGYYATALGTSLLITQSWRAFSETLRADWRGGGRISAYQVMAMVSVVCVVLFLLAIPADPAPRAELRHGMLFLWDPAVFLVLAGVGFAVFVYTGRSTVTSAQLTFHVVREKI